MTALGSPAVEIKDILDDSSSGLNLVFGTNLFVGFEPKSPDRCVTVYDSGGFDPDPNSVFKPTITVQVRSDKGEYTAAFDLAADIKDFLHGKANFDSGTSRYILAWSMGDIIDLGYDEDRRIKFSINFRLHRTSV